MMVAFLLKNLRVTNHLWQAILLGNVISFANHLMVLHADFSVHRALRCPVHTAHLSDAVIIVTIIFRGTLR